MTPFNVLQVALGVGALAVAVQRLYILFWRAPLAHDTFLSAIQTALDAGHPQLAREIAAQCRPAWAAVLTECLLDNGSPTQRERAAEQLRDEFDRQAARGIYAIRACGRMAGPLAFLGVILEIGRAFSGGEGLVALQRGLAASRGLEQALLTFAIGVATGLACLSIAATLQRQSRTLRDALRKITPARLRGGEGGAEALHRE